MDSNLARSNKKWYKIANLRTQSLLRVILWAISNSRYLKERRTKVNQLSKWAVWSCRHQLWDREIWLERLWNEAVEAGVVHEKEVAEKTVFSTLETPMMRIKSTLPNSIKKGGNSYKRRRNSFVRTSNTDLSYLMSNQRWQKRTMELWLTDSRSSRKTLLKKNNATSS